MEQPPKIEKNEQLEQFAEELQAAIELIQNKDFLIESGQLTEKEAKQMQLVFTDFESWGNVKDDKAALIKIIQVNLGEHREPIDQYEIQGSGEVGLIKINVYPTDQAGVNLVVYKYKGGDVVWAIQPEDFVQELK